MIQPILVPSVDTVDDRPGRFSTGKALFVDVAMGPASLLGVEPRIGRATQTGHVEPESFPGISRSRTQTQAYRAIGSSISGVVASGVVLPGGAGFGGDGLGRAWGIAEYGDDGGWRVQEYLAHCSGSDVQVGDAEALEP